jgi:hypothetical protein
LAGLGLSLIALGPILVIATGITLTVFAIIDLALHTSAGIATVADTVDSRITPQITKIESAFDGLAAPLSQFKDSVDGAMTAFDQLGSIQIAKGAWGTTPSVHVKIPPNDLHVGDVTVDVPHVGLGGVRIEKITKPLATIDNGTLFNQATPSMPIPPTPIVLSMEPVHRALAPLGREGAVGRDVKAAESGVDRAIADLGRPDHIAGNQPACLSRTIAVALTIRVAGLPQEPYQGVK